MIENDKQLQYSYEQVARMYRLRDRDAAEALYDPDTRDDVVESITIMIRKIEREIAAYLAARQEKAENSLPQKTVAAGG